MQIRSPWGYQGGGGGRLRTKLGGCGFHEVQILKNRGIEEAWESESAGAGIERGGLSSGGEGSKAEEEERKREWRGGGMERAGID